MNKILVVDDEQSMREFLAIMLKKEGHDVVIAEHGEGAIKAVQSEIFDLVITDMKMTGIDGLGVLRAVKEASPETSVIMITAFASTESAIEAMKLGAADYLLKPFKVDELKLTIANTLEKRLLRKENTLLRREMESRAGFENFVGKSNAMQKIFTVIRQVADTASTVLISGESGTGKELVARAIHFHSPRKGRPFITVNCGALPETLLESELFGHMKGSFTGAASNKQGLFEAAHCGTIFLDEISATTPALQIKLLRILQEREFMRVGGTTTIHVDVRVIAASNRNLEQEVAKGLFREDLFYRLNVIPIHLPPLRERRDDIPLLVKYFIERKTSERKTVSPEAMSALMRHHWPGNVRELENMIERLVIMSLGETIGIREIPDTISAVRPCAELGALEIPNEGLDLEQLLENVEATFLRRAIQKSGGSKTEAAKLLKLTFRSFRHRLKKYDSGDDSN